MSDFIGCELPGPRLNVLRVRRASAEDLALNRCCQECLRSAHWVPKFGKQRSVLRCLLFDREASPQEICDGFESYAWRAE